MVALRKDEFKPGTRPLDDLEIRLRRLGAVFATLLHGGILGALITLAPQPIYRWYRGGTEVLGLSPLEDQQLAGLLMWVPLGTIYLAACLMLARRFLTDREPHVGASAADASR